MKSLLSQRLITIIIAIIVFLAVTGTLDRITSYFRCSPPRSYDWRHIEDGYLPTSKGQIIFKIREEQNKLFFVTNLVSEDGKSHTLSRNEVNTREVREVFLEFAPPNDKLEVNPFLLFVCSADEGWIANK
ncbi:hypothetical protein HY407_01855 [Candidatus Gottesmanbacteria bacterium]|nr:hypothetical protein [Candidatus Gottesmanbacteria bacterium]